MLRCNRKYIFIHIPKTGGSSIEKELKYKHSHLDHAHYCTSKEYKECFVFTVIRNPYDRVVSDYKWSQVNNDPPDMKQLFEGKPFDYFVKTFYNIKLEDIQHWKKVKKRPGWYNMHHLTHCRSQVSMLHPVGNIDYFIRFENLQEGFNVVCSKLGRPVTQLPHVNKCPGKHYTEYYNDETRQIVTEMFKDDLDRFGYAYE